MQNKIGKGIISMNISEVNYSELKINKRNIPLYYSLIKRGVDVTLSILGIILTLPIMIIIAGTIKVTSEGPILFKQTRVGYLGNKFKIYKFRTMYNNAEEQLKKILKEKEETSIIYKPKDDVRITMIGKILRKYSLDELPQLFNILLGDMSLVGPRPLIVREIENCSVNQYMRHIAKPGITGYAQIKCRSNTTFKQQMDNDLYYVKNQCLLLDFKILLSTIPAVVKSKNAW
ncbi:MAG: sugar transferase [Clostridium sulfidigenes]|uniref:Sugar transferase n=1 Tax=Clostridium sulfidigenes TaxID=318464 RepID=A0A927W5R6_9CLOT|nr:sugar transferase [Clostridium sulfidigenes]